MMEIPGPFLSIAIPVFNGEDILAPMLASLDAQDWNLFEVRFGDDGSTDGTRRALDDFAARHAGRVFVESHENIGEGLTRNRLLRQAQGEYIWFCDADDELAPGCISRIVDILVKTPVDFMSLCYGEKNDDPLQARLSLDPVPVTIFELLLSMPCATVAKVVKTSLLRDHKIDFPPTKVGPDLVQSLYAACHSHSALFWYAKPYWVRRHSASASGSVSEVFCEHLSRSLALARGAADAFPAFKRAIEVQLLDYWNYFLRRLRDDATPEVREKWVPFVKKSLGELVSANDNPLLRIPRAFSRREGEALGGKREALRRESAALKREQAALRREQDLLNSLSWRITAPLRAIQRLFAQKGKA